MLPRGDSAARENLTFAQYSVKILKYIFNILYFMLIREMSLFVFFISLLIVAQHVSGNHVPIIRR